MRIDALERLRAALEDLDTAPPLDQVRKLGLLIEDAKGIVGDVSALRGAALAELTAPGGEYYRRIPALSDALSLHRSRIDASLAAGGTGRSRRPARSYDGED